MPFFEAARGLNHLSIFNPGGLFTQKRNTVRAEDWNRSFNLLADANKD
ncbi:MAG: hypothetical protein ACR2IS_18825 [Nitrososphaeraceae archaeon]